LEELAVSLFEKQTVLWAKKSESEILISKFVKF